MRKTNQGNGIFRTQTKSACSDGGCCSHHKSKESTKSNTVGAKQEHSIDSERGESGIEQIVLSIQGMTCVCCEATLQKVLDDLPSTSNIKINLLHSQVKFDNELNLGTVENVIHHLERSTGFQYERVVKTSQSLDISTGGSASNLLRQQWPTGVSDMVVLKNQDVRLYFDPKVIGARDLVECGFASPLQLAVPPPPAVSNQNVQRLGWITLLSTFLTIPVLILAWAPLPPHPLVYAAVSLTSATVVQAVVGGPIYWSALKSLVYSRTVGMDFLVALSTTVAYIFSLVSFASLAKGKPLPVADLYTTSTLLITLIVLGRYISMFSCQKALGASSIQGLQPSTVILVIPGTTNERPIDSRLLQYGDVFRVLPEARVATDGTVISGESEVDESMLTGERIPVRKVAGAAVIAGSMNCSASLTVRVARLPQENTINTLTSMMEEAKLLKPTVQQLADRVARYFIPLILVFTSIDFVIWIAIGVYVQHQALADSAIQAALFAITVLVVSCPCGVVLAAPMVMATAGQVAAKHGMILKSSAAVEDPRKVTHVVFDKTGTLTQGKLSVIAEHYQNGLENSTKAILLGLLQDVQHPVAYAIVKHLKTLGVTSAPVEGINSIPGSGVEGTFMTRGVRCGNSRWLGVDSDHRVRSLLSQDLTVFCVLVDNDLAAVFGLEDILRPDAVAVIKELTLRGITTSILSGDDDGAVQSIAAKLGIPHTNAKSRCSPSGKQRFVKSICETSADNRVLFCGDGINDILALEEATIGVHMSDGTELPHTAADAVLIQPKLGSILIMINLSRAACLRIWLSFAWAFLYNLFAISLAAGAFVSIRIPTAYAGLGELISVLPVVLIAVQLRWVKLN